MFHSMDWPEIWLVLQRIAITYALTVLIGWDREKETHSAGVRTFPIVGMASCGYLMILGPRSRFGGPVPFAARFDHRHWIRGRRRDFEGRLYREGNRDGGEHLERGRDRATIPSP